MRGVWIIGLCAVLASCVHTSPPKERREIDSLNGEAYAWRYKDLERSCRVAQRAYDGEGNYKQGRAEAANHLGFCAFVRMDFEEAERWHKEVGRLTKNEVELLIADIGMMKIYQRRALNKEFYDYRNSAARRMKRIAEEVGETNENVRLNYARSEFHLVSAVYHYFLQQHSEAMASVDEVTEEELRTDSNQWLGYHYVKGTAALNEGQTTDERKMRMFDQLFIVWREAARKGYLYFEANALQGLAELMVAPSGYDFFKERRYYALKQLADSLLVISDKWLVISGDSLITGLLGVALEKGKEYGDGYQVANAYVTLGKYLNWNGRYEEALDTLQRALGEVQCPETVSRIREQMSVAYAGLGMKRESDENRNIYLDILDDTRQDKEWESRYQALEAEARQQNLILLLVVAGFVLLFLCFGLFNRLSKKRNKVHLYRLKLLLDICQKITSSIPADARTEEEITDYIRTAIAPELKELGLNPDNLFPVRQSGGLSKLERLLLQVISPYVEWAVGNGLTSISLGDEQRRLEKQRYVYEQHIAENKRQNLMKRACMSIVNGIHPYVDRIINEVKKLDTRYKVLDTRYEVRDTREELQYIDELVSTINDYNELLALWIKTKQGSLNLHIETFGLDELFGLIGKGSRAFEMKRQTLEVKPTQLRVKADKALTLFMMNTLAENARKYTPQGGTVRVYAEAREDFVEVSVEDNGRGLSAEDVKHIVGEKVYDSKRIGMDDAADREELRKSKGSGFGLMNCKGIIEKYRKTSTLFRVCLFGVESRLGAGSRFFFRLPMVASGLKLFALFFSLSFFSCHGQTEEVQSDPVELIDGEEYVALLDSASDYANDAYFCNVEGKHEQALLHIDSARICLNEHYRRYANSPQSYMTLTGEGEAAELEWWNGEFDSDYHVILDIRNEAAVAFLALKQWEAYSYNNAAYTMLYKLLGEDRTLEVYCQQLERSTGNKAVGIVLAVMLLLVLPFGLYVLYFRKRLLSRWNLEQVLAINEQVLRASQSVQSMVDAAFDAVDELLPTDCMSLAVYNESTRQLEYVSHPSRLVAFSSVMERCFDRQAYISEAGIQAVPLVVEAGGTQRCIGVLGLQRKEGTVHEPDYLLLELVARYMAIVVFNAVVKIETKQRDIEVAQEEARRASWEESLLHVQNMVLDNCLSTIKHETVYYPNKVKQLVGKLRTMQDTRDEKQDTRDKGQDTRETLSAIGELMEYYKGIFTLLSSCASRQLEEVTFRRSVVPVSELMEYAEKYFGKIAPLSPPKGGICDESYISYKSYNESLPSGEAGGAACLCDRTLLCFLLENLIDEACSVPLAGELCLSAEQEGEFVRFSFTDKRREKGREELNQLFHPDAHRMEYLICKQVIREHDEYAGRRGCRINAEPCHGGGFTVYFTVPSG